MSFILSMLCARYSQSSTHNDNNITNISHVTLLNWMSFIRKSDRIVYVRKCITAIYCFGKKEKKKIRLLKSKEVKVLVCKLLVVLPVIICDVVFVTMFLIQNNNNNNSKHNPTKWKKIHAHSVGIIVDCK